MQEIDLRNAKTTLSQLIDKVKQGEPSIIMRNGQREAVLISFAEW